MQDAISRGGRLRTDANALRHIKQWKGRFYKGEVDACERLGMVCWRRGWPLNRAQPALITNSFFAESAIDTMEYTMALRSTPVSARDEMRTQALRN